MIQEEWDSYEKGCFILPVYVCKLLSDIGSEKNHQSLIGHYLSILGPKETNNVLVNRVVSVKKVPTLLSNITGLFF